MTLPAPTTTSPGKLRVLYHVGTHQHTVGVNIKAGVDITDLGPLRDDALSIAHAMIGVLSTDGASTGWRVTNPAGVTLYEEVFDTPQVGAVTAFTHVSVSASLALTGKGHPAIGLQAGQVRFTVFPGYYDEDIWNQPRVPVATLDGMNELRVGIVALSVAGADFFGSDVDWRLFVDTQINAHYQKNFGL